jgi:hypothetical protein
MTPNNVADQIEGLVISANGRFEKAILRVQGKLYSDLVTILKFIETDADGNILQNSGNRSILRAAQSQFDKTILSSEYQDAVETHLKVGPKIDALNTAYFEAVSSAFKPNRVFIKELQSQAIESVNNLVLNEGLAAQVKIPLNDILNQNINSGGSFSGMLKQLKTFIEGDPSREGKLLSYSKQILRDTLFNYARAYQQSVVADLKLIWYKYVGGIIDTTRPFCAERVDKFFTENEVKSWASLSWQGKNPLTTESSIFVYCGGFNCAHQLIAVDESIVPDEDLKRLETA